MKKFNRELLGTNRGLKPEDLKVGQKVRLITHKGVEEIVVITKTSSENVAFRPSIDNANMINFRRFHTGISTTKEIYETI